MVSTLVGAIVWLSWAGAIWAEDAAPALGRADFHPAPEGPVGWRGDGTGRFPGATPVTEWDAVTGKNIVWRTEMKWGFCSPIVVGDRVFVVRELTELPLRLSRPASFFPLRDAPYTFALVCLRAADGVVLWQRRHQAPVLPKTYGAYWSHYGFAFATPASDGRRVYARLHNAAVVCHDLDGNLVWTWRSGGLDAGAEGCASPVLAAGKLIVRERIMAAWNGSDRSRVRLVALDSRTGRISWERVLPPPAAACPGTPGVLRLGDASYLVDPNGCIVRAADGRLMNDFACAPDLEKRLFDLSGLRTHKGGMYGEDATAPVSRTVDGQRGGLPMLVAFGSIRRMWSGITWLSGCSPLVVGQTVYVPQTGHWTCIVAATFEARPDGGLGLLSHEKWEPFIPAYVGSSLLYHNGYVYNPKLFGGTRGACLQVRDAANGKLFERRGILDSPRAVFRQFGEDAYSSLSVAGNHIFYGLKTGRIAVLEPGPEGTIRAVNHLQPFTAETMRRIVADGHFSNPSGGDLYHSSPFFQGDRTYLRTKHYVYCIGRTSKPLTVPPMPSPASAVAASRPDLPAKDRIGAYERALAEARTVDEKKLTLSRIAAQEHDPAALPLATAHLKDKALAYTAADTVFVLASRTQEAHPRQALEALNALKELDLAADMRSAIATTSRKLTARLLADGGTGTVLEVEDFALSKADVLDLDGAGGGKVVTFAQPGAEARTTVKLEKGEYRALMYLKADDTERDSVWLKIGAREEAVWPLECGRLVDAERWVEFTVTDAQPVPVSIRPKDLGACVDRIVIAPVVPDESERTKEQNHEKHR